MTLHSMKGVYIITHTQRTCSHSFDSFFNQYTDYKKSIPINYNTCITKDN